MLLFSFLRSGNNANNNKSDVVTRVKREAKVSYWERSVLTLGSLSLKKKDQCLLLRKF